MSDLRNDGSRWPRSRATVLSTLVLLVAVLSLAIPNAKAQIPQFRQLGEWRPLQQKQYERYRYVFEPYDIHAFPSEVWAIEYFNIRIFRFQFGDYCRNDLCLTVVLNECDRVVCPSTAVFVRKQVELAKFMVRDIQFLIFPISKERSVTVLLHRLFVSAAQGLAGDQDGSERP